MATAKPQSRKSPEPIIVGRGRKKLSPAELEARKEFLANETKEEKFKRLCIPRVNKALKAIQQIGNLAAYKPTITQIEQIMTALANSAQAAQNKMEGVRQQYYTFTLNQ